MGALRKIAIALTSLVLFFGLAEGVARLAGMTPKHVAAPMFSWVDRGELYTMEPNRQWVMPGDLKLVRVNSLGLRGPQIGEKGAWERIVLLGDSVAFGYDVVEKEAIAARLQKALFLQGLRLEVINAAIPGWCARQHRLFLETHGRALTPDVVLATVVLNDIPELQHGQAELRASLESANALNWLVRRSALAAGVRSALASSESPFARAASVRELAMKPDSASAREGMAMELDELAGVAAAARDLKARFGLVLLPFRFQLTTPASDAPQRRLRAFAHARGIPVLDLLPALRDHPPADVFVDQVHLSALGNEIVADRIAAWLQRRRLIGPDRRPPPA